MAFKDFRTLEERTLKNVLKASECPLHQGPQKILATTIYIRCNILNSFQFFFKGNFTLRATAIRDNIENHVICDERGVPNDKIQE